MKKILAFGASTSKQSINHTLASYTARLFKSKADITTINIIDFQASMYSIDQEKEHGIPAIIKKFYENIENADLIIISLAEHNGTYTAAFKNIMDWTSRYKSDFFYDKPLFLLSTSPGSRGGSNVMQAALSRFPIFGARIIDHFSLPFFDQNFNPDLGIVNSELAQIFALKIASLNNLI